MNEPIWKLPLDLLGRSIEVMRPRGSKGCEGLALWLGKNPSADEIVITHVIAVEGPGFSSHPLQLSLSWRAMAALTDVAAKLDSYLAGQAHSHPGETTDLSDVDMEFGIRCEDYLSLVCPHYAQQDVPKLSDWGSHVFERGRYRRMSLPEAASRMHFTGTAVEVIHLQVKA